MREEEEEREVKEWGGGIGRIRVSDRKMGRERKWRRKRARRKSWRRREWRRRRWR